MKGKNQIYTILLVIIFLLSLITGWYRVLAGSLMILVLVMVLDKLGRGIVLRELIAMHTGFVCILMPLIGYIVYNKTNVLALLWVRYMNIPEEVYFGYALPAVTGFIMVLCWPINRSAVSDEGPSLQSLILKAKKILPYIPKIGIYLMVIGVIVFGFSEFLPVALQFAFFLFYFSAFAGFLYVYFTKEFKRKSLVLGLFAFFIFAQALSSGMFTIVAYMGITLFSFFFLGRKVAFWKKLSLFVVGIFVLFLIQSVKQSYRKSTWGEVYGGNRAVLFMNLAKEKVESFSDVDFSDIFFPIYYRTNQGINTSMVMNRFPSQIDFDGGKALFLTIASSFVPRVFWPNKPEAGGKFNMKYYAGINIEGWSTNVGPLGEAYGSFGVGGGILYLMFLGLIIRWSYLKMFSLSLKVPLLFLWIPVLFYQITYSSESDTLQILNSLVKSAFFIWIVYRFLPKWFGVFRSSFGLSRSTIKILREKTLKEGIKTGIQY